MENQLSATDIRAKLLEVIHQQTRQARGNQNLQSGSVLRQVAHQLQLPEDDIQWAQALLTQLHDLFRTGYLAWGMSLYSPDPPNFHVTEAGRALLSQLSRDPGNPSAYQAHVHKTCKVNPVAASYLNEGLACYVGGLHKAAAVMVGAAAESLTLELRDALVNKLNALSQSVPKDLEDWRIKRVLDSIKSYLTSKKSNMPSELWSEFESFWPAFTQQIRTVRNEAGHPSSVDPITYETVHALLLIFPEHARLQNKLVDWISHQLT